MAGLDQQGRTDGSEVAAARAQIDRALAFADWVNQAPTPSEPQTAAMTVNEMLNKIVGELARIAACYELKQAAEYLQDTVVMNSLADDNLAEETKKHQEEAQRLLNCPPIK